MDRLVYVGQSWGAGSRSVFAAVDPRWDAVVFIGGGIDERMHPTLPEASNVNFLPYIDVPTLVVNGRHDEEHPRSLCIDMGGVRAAVSWWGAWTVEFAGRWGLPGRIGCARVREGLGGHSKLPALTANAFGRYHGGRGGFSTSSSSAVVLVEFLCHAGDTGGGWGVGLRRGPAVWAPTVTARLVRRAAICKRAQAPASWRPGARGASARRRQCVLLTLPRRRPRRRARRRG